MCIEWSLVYLLLVRANRELAKDVLTCRPFENSMYKSQHPDDTDDLDVVGMSSEDEAEGMGDILGICRATTRPPRPSSTAECLRLIARLREEQASAASWEPRPPFEVAEMD